jgi:hypothetical protein
MPGGWGVGCGVSANEHSCAHRAQINNSIFNLWSTPNPVLDLKFYSEIVLPVFQISVNVQYLNNCNEFFRALYLLLSSLKSRPVACNSTLLKEYLFIELYILLRFLLVTWGVVAVLLCRRVGRSYIMSLRLRGSPFSS